MATKERHSSPHPNARPGRTLVVVCLALATVVSVVSSLNVAIPSIARDTSASQTQLSWIIDAYALVFASLLLLGGALGDRYGRRRALLVGLAIFGGAAGAAMLYANAHWLIAMRTVLGLGAALVMPATLSTITSTFPEERRTRAIGVWAGVAGASAILGLLASGIVLEFWSWRSVFAFSACLAVISLIGTLVAVPESADPDAPPVDWVGAAITVCGLGLLVYSVIEAPNEGWTSPRTLLGILAGLVVLAGFVVWELHTRYPLLDPRLFLRRGFSAGTLAISAQFFAFFGLIFILLQYLQLVLGQGALEAGLRLLPVVVGMMPTANVLAPRMAERIGNARVSAVGLLLLAGSFGWLTTLDASTSYWSMAGVLLVLGVGMGLAMTPATHSITAALPPSKQGVASAMNDLARELGGALGIAVLGSVLQSTYRSHLDLDEAPPPVVAQARTSLAIAQHLGPDIAARAGSAFTDGLHQALGAAVIVLLAAAAATLVIGWKAPSPNTGEGASAEARRESTVTGS